MGKKPRKRKWRNIAAHHQGRSLNEGDLAIFKFLWKWKVADSRVLCEPILKHEKPEVFNQRLRKLERNKLIRSKYDMMTSFNLWTPSDFGLHVIRESLGDIRDHGFLSASPNNDRLVSRKGDHRHDGYVRLKNARENRIFALGVQLHAGAADWYRSIIDRYPARFNIQQALCLADSPFTVDQVRRGKKPTQEKSVRYHAFVDLAEHQDNGWEFVVTNECSGKLDTVRGIMRRLCGDTYGKYVGDMWGQSRVTVHYDKPKVLGKKRT